jgi:hypothetical protein
VTSSSSLEVVGAPAATNDDLHNDGLITADVDAQATSGYGTLSGTLSVPGTLRNLPDPKRVFDYYLDRGTPIYPSGYGTGSIYYTLLSPNSSPWGSPNSDGIYIVDASDGDLDIAACRIVGTLVVINLPADAEVRVWGRNNWEPAYPRLLAASVDELSGRER